MLFPGKGNCPLSARTKVAFLLISAHPSRDKNGWRFISSQFEAQGRRGPYPHLNTDPDGSLSHCDQLGSTGAKSARFPSRASGFTTLQLIR